MYEYDIASINLKAFYRIKDAYNKYGDPEKSLNQLFVYAQSCLTRSHF